MPERIPIPRSARLSEDSEWQLPAADYAPIGKPSPRFSWLSPVTLWQSRNNVLASLTGDPTENARRAWVAAQRLALADRGEPPAVVEDFTLERPELRDFSFMLLGDAGEGDVSQYATVPAFLSASAGTEFAMIASDVVYPAGDVNQYIGKFFVPYAPYPQPIYAVPGNHDWLDGLAGFMRHFCAAETPGELFRPPKRARYARTAMLVHRLLWRRAEAVRADTLTEAEALRGEASRRGPQQPNMYFCIDTPQLRIIGIDVGVLGRLDYDQGEWLKRVAASSKPKLLVSGKPIFSGADFSPRRILAPEGSEAASAGLLWNVVKDPANNFVAMVAGDIHHYQRHTVKLEDGRVLPCVLTGGGGAFMSSTHQIAKVDRPEVSESGWVVFPTRGDSLRAYSISLARRWRWLTPWNRGGTRGIPADQAAAIVAERHGLELANELARGEGSATGPVPVSRRSRLIASLIFPRHAWFARGGFDPGRVSEVLDWDEPPFFKNFVRADIEGDRLVMTAYGVTGLRRDQEAPAVIDRVEVELGERG